MAGNELVVRWSVMEGLRILADSLKDGYSPLQQWIDDPIKAPTFGAGTTKGAEFIEVVRIKAKYDRCSTGLHDRAVQLQLALKGLSAVAADVRKAYEDANNGVAGAAAALDAAVTSIVARIDSVLVATAGK